MSVTVEARQKCQGRSRQTGKPCKLTAEPGRQFCGIHGGKALAGPDSGTWKHGRFSKYLPARLLDKYHESLNDPDLLNLTEQIAVTDARIAELYASLDRGESGHLWKQLKDARRRSHSDDLSVAKAALNEMDRLIGEGSTLESTWDQIESAQEHRRKLVNTERRRIQDMQANIPAARAVAFAVAITQIIRKHVTDRPTLQAIQRDIAGLLQRKETEELLPPREAEVEDD